METGKRSLVKALINSALGFGSYLIYERVWTRINWGRHSAVARPVAGPGGARANV